ncbi:MAG: nucleotide exchange factor GrpE [Proteobacteria bacterium]|nr:nucleotide exchange factor GrpE [Pseudomonadota bacterium]
MQDTMENNGKLRIKVQNVEDRDDPVEEAAAPVEEVAAPEGAEADTAPESQSPRTREEAEEALKEFQDRLLRAAADFENYKKRSQREVDEFRKYATESVMKDLLPVVDNLERALESAGQIKGEAGKLAEGVDLTRKEILLVMERYGVKPLSSMGQPFDPAFHQALMAEESDQPADTVVREMQRGYKMKDRLLRPALVVVAKETENT